MKTSTRRAARIAISAAAVVCIPMTLACGGNPMAPSPVVPSAATFTVSTVSFTSDPQDFEGRGESRVYTLQNAAIRAHVARSRRFDLSCRATCRRSSPAPVVAAPHCPKRSNQARFVRHDTSEHEFDIWLGLRGQPAYVQHRGGARGHSLRRVRARFDVGDAIAREL